MPTQRLDLDIHPLRALVTGAASSLGKAVARRLAADGLDVTVHDGDDVKSAGSMAEGARADGLTLCSGDLISGDLNCRTGEQRITSTLGHIDLLVNVTDASWFGSNDLVGTAAHGAGAAGTPHALADAFASAMAARGHGHIVSVPGRMSDGGTSDGIVNDAHVTAVESATRAWSARYSLRGVRVNAVVAAQGSSRTAVADVVSFLVSSRAEQITGTTISVDGRLRHRVHEAAKEAGERVRTAAGAR